MQTRSGPLHGGRQESQPNSRRNDRAVIVSLTGARQLALTRVRHVAVASMTIRFARPINSKGEKNGSVPGVTIHLIRVLDSAPDITQQMEIVVQVIAPADTRA